MATVTFIVLVILTIYCAIVLSEHEAPQRNDRRSSSRAEQQMALIIKNQRNMVTKIRERTDTIQRLRGVYGYITVLQEEVKKLQEEFACLHHTPCASPTCKLIHLSKTKNTKMCRAIN